MKFEDVRVGDVERAEETIRKLEAERDELLEALMVFLMEHRAMMKMGKLSPCLWAVGKAERAIAKHTKPQKED